MLILNKLTQSATSAEGIDDYENKQLKDKICKLSSDGLLANNDWLLEKVNELES